MCYICEARGTVGGGYRATQALLAVPHRVLTHAVLKAGWPSWGDSHDWTRAPTQRLWTNADLKEYGKEGRREHLT